MEVLGAGMIVLYIIYYVVMLGLNVAMYVLRSLGVQTIAKRRGIEKAWLAWIPVGSSWVLGSISDHYQYTIKGKVKNKRKVMLILDIVNVALLVAFFAVYIALFVGMIGAGVGYMDEEELMASMFGSIIGVFGLMIPMMGVSIALSVFHYMALYDLYTSVNPSNNVLFLVLSIVFNVTEPFFIFFNRKKDDGMRPQMPPTGYIPPQNQYQYQYQQPRQNQWQNQQQYQPPQQWQQPQDPWNRQ